MKIFHVITSLKIGGAESALFNFLQQTLEDKNEHFVAYFYPGDNLNKIKELGVKTFNITGFLNKYDFVSYFKLKKIIKEINPDIIHSALWSANFISKIISRSLSIPIICDLHSNFLYDGKFRRFLERFTLLKADKYVAVSKSVKGGFLKSFPDKSKQLDKITVIIPNAIDADYITEGNKYLSRQDIGLGENDFIFGAVGRLESIKCYDLLIKSFAEVLKKNRNEFIMSDLLANRIEVRSSNKKRPLRTLKLVIIGSGSQEHKLKDLVKFINIESNVIFIDQTIDIYSYYPLFDCFVVSSKSEGLSIALLEAMSFGLPVISTAENLEHDLLVNEKNGLLVSPCNIEELIVAIERVHMNNELLGRMKIENLKLIRGSFSIYRLKESYNNLYLDICSKQGS